MTTESRSKRPDSTRTEGARHRSIELRAVRQRYAEVGGRF